MSQNEPVSVRILDREYTVGVEPAERDSLTAAARMLDARMREIRGNNRMAAVLARKGYDYRYVFAMGAGHVDNRVVMQTLPAAMEWLWRDYPR